MQDSHNYHPYVGKTPFFMCQRDHRFSYCLYVPPHYYETTAQAFTLLTIVHGSRRTAETYRDQFAEFADKNNCIVLAPLFPVGVLNVTDQHSYKYIRHENLAYDEILHHIIEEVRGRFVNLSLKMLLHGFSGGGQFAHRYLYLNPERLRAVSIGAPGTVSLLGSSLDWWPGTRDFKQKFGKEPNVKAMQSVAVQLLVGEKDTETWDVLVDKNSPTWATGANDSGHNRRERLDALKVSLETNGISVIYEVIPDIAHEGMEVLDNVKIFFRDIIKQSG